MADKRFEIMYEMFLELSEEKRAEIAYNSSHEIYKYFMKKGEDEDCVLGFIGALFGYFIGSDGVVSPKETALHNGMWKTNYTPEEMTNYVKLCRDNLEFEELDEVVDDLPPEIKEYACQVVLTVLTADGELTEEEKRLFEELLA